MDVGGIPADRVFPGQAPVVVACSQHALRAVLHPEVGLVLWPRRMCSGCKDAAAELAQGLPFCAEAAGAPEGVALGVLQGLPTALPDLRADIQALAGLFADLCQASAVRVRLEASDTVTCPRLHVDAVGLRLLCTYAGPGTEWQDGTGTIRRMPAGHVGLFKGRAWPDDSPRTLHRSPAVSHLPAGQRARLLLCIDRMGPH